MKKKHSVSSKEIEQLLNELENLRPDEIYERSSISRVDIELTNNKLSFYQYESQGKFGIKSSSEEIVLPAKYDQIKFNDRMTENFVAVQKNGKWGVVRTGGKEPKATDFLYDDVYWDDLEILKKVRIGNKYGLIFINGIPFLPVQFDEIVSGIISGIFSFSLGNKYGVTNGKITTPPIYDGIEYDAKDKWLFVIVHYKEKEGFIDETGNFTEDFDSCALKKKL